MCKSHQVRAVGIGWVLLASAASRFSSYNAVFCLGLSEWWSRLQLDFRRWHIIIAITSHT